MNLILPIFMIREFDPTIFHDPLIFILAILWSDKQIYMILWSWIQQKNESRASVSIYVYVGDLELFESVKN